MKIKIKDYILDDGNIDLEAIGVDPYCVYDTLFDQTMFDYGFSEYLALSMSWFIRTEYRKDVIDLDHIDEFIQLFKEHLIEEFIEARKEINFFNNLSEGAKVNYKLIEYVKRLEDAFYFCLRDDKQDFIDYLMTVSDVIEDDE